MRHTAWLPLRSFSFRVGGIIFLALCALLTTTRVLFYFQSIESAQASVRKLLDAHVEEIANGLEHSGPRYARDLVESIVEEARDRHLFLEIEQHGRFTGNLTARERIPLQARGRFEVTLRDGEGEAAQRLLFRVIDYPNGVIVRAAYDMESVELLRRTLATSLLANAAIALGLSLVLAFLIVKLIDHYFRGFNTAFERVMAGNLDYRVATRGANDEFEKLASNLNRMLDWMKALLSTVKDANTAIAHDIRTPLSRLRLDMSALAQDPALAPKTQARIEEQIEQVDALVEMFDSLLVIAKAEARAGLELFERFDLAALARDVLAFYEPILEEKQVALENAIPPSTLDFTGDKQLISQALFNLLDNACKYARPHAHIRIELATADDAVRLVVSDNGSGIPPALIHRAKERFVRGDASRHTKGFGLGLSLVNAVAILHQGELLLEDNMPGLRATLVLKHHRVATEPMSAQAGATR